MNVGMYGLPGGAPDRRVTGLLHSSTLLTQPQVGSVYTAANARLTAATTVANTWQQMISVTGRGCVNWACFFTGSTAVYEVELWLDGVRVHSTPTPLSMTGAGASGTGVILVGGGSYDSVNGVSTVTFQPLFFEQSLSIMFRCATGGVTAYAAINAEVHA